MACQRPDAAPAPRREEPAGCATGQILDGEVCVPEACGVGTWGSLPVDAATVYVSEGGEGEGTEVNPLGSIQAGVDLAGLLGGGGVAVAAGTYVQTIAMGDDHRDVTLMGRCRELVTIDGSEGDEAPALEIKGDERTPKVEVEGVTVTGGTFTGLWVQRATVTLRAADVRENTLAGVLAVDATLTLDGVGVYGTMPDRRGDHGQGVSAEYGATLTAIGCIVQENAFVGVFVVGSETIVDLVDTEVLDTFPSPDGGAGFGLAVGEGAALNTDGCRIQANTGAGVLASDPGTTVDLVDSEVLDTLPSPDDTGGRGITVQDGVVLTATGCIVQGNTEIGVYASGAGSTVDLVDTQVLDTSARPDQAFGRGVEVQGGALLSATRCTFQGNTEGGVYASDFGTTADLVESAVLDTLPSPDGTGGRGITVQDGAVLTVTGGIVQGNTEVGVFGEGAGTTLVLVDTEVGGTRRGRDAGFASGMSVQQDAFLQASDCVVSGTEGPGLYVAADGRAELDRVLLTEGRFSGAVILGGSATLTDSTVTGTLPDAEWGGGIGIYAYNASSSPTLILTDSTIGPHPYAAVWLDGQGTYDVQRNTLSGSGGIDIGSSVLHGNAVFAERGVTAWDGVSGLRLSGNAFEGASAIAVLLDGASADLAGNTWSDNGADLWQQHCDGIVALTDAEPDWDTGWTVCPPRNLLTAYDLVFTSLYLPEVEPQE